MFPNALIPTVALGGVQVTLLLGGTVLVERIFSYEGIGNMAIDAVINRDFPLIQGLVLTFAVLFIALNLAVDLAGHAARSEVAPWLTSPLGGSTARAPSRWIAGLERGGPRLWLGGALVGILFLVALLAPLLAPHDPIEQDLMSAQLPPAWIAGRRSGLSARHRQSRPLRAVAPDLRGTDRGRRGADRGVAGGGLIGIALGLIAGMFRRLGRPGRLAPDRCLDGVSRRCCCRSCWRR